MLTSRESSILASVNADSGWDLVKLFSTVRRERPDEYEYGATQLIGRLESLNLPVRLHRPRIYQGVPTLASLSCNGKAYRCKAAALSPSQSPITCELVYAPARDGTARVHTNDPQALFGEGVSRDSLRAIVEGRIVLTDGLSNPGRSELLEALGARAIVTINPGQAVHWGASSVVWGSPSLEDVSRLPGIVSMAVNHHDGQELARLARVGARVTLQATVQHGWFDQVLPTVEIAGSGPNADEFILLHGHLDSWDLGVGDNATGDAVLLETARALHRERAQLNRSVRIAWWPGHSAGRYAGSTWYADRFAHDLLRHCVAHLNCDSPGCVGATDYSSIRGMAEAQSLVANAVRDLFDQASRLERPGRVGDYSFSNIGITGAMLTSSMVPPDERKRRGWYSVGGNGGSPTWHTEDDVFAVADRDVLENDIRLYTLLAARLSAEGVPPLDYRVPARDIAARIADAAQHAGSVVDVEALGETGQRLLARVEAAYQQDAVMASQWPSLMRASRHLVRVGYASKGPFEQDPAFAQGFAPLLSAARSAGSDPAAQLSFQRGANAVLAELEAALNTLG